MGRKVTTVYECDRCGFSGDKASILRRLRVEAYRTLGFTNLSGAVTLDVCQDCEDVIATVLRGKDGTLDTTPIRRGDADE